MNEGERNTAMFEDKCGSFFSHMRLPPRNIKRHRSRGSKPRDMRNPCLACQISHVRFDNLEEAISYYSSS